MKTRLLSRSRSYSARPITQTSSGPLPQTPVRALTLLTPIDTADQALPFQCRTVPELPTAQTSFGPLPQTAVRPFVTPSSAPKSAFVQALPFQCSTVPESPT